MVEGVDSGDVVNGVGPWFFESYCRVKTLLGLAETLETRCCIEDFVKFGDANVIND